MPNIIRQSDAEAASHHYPSEKIWWKAALAKGRQQELCWAKYEPGATYPRHSHAYEQVSVIIQGRMRVTVGEETGELGPGDMWFVPADTPHGGEVLGDEPVIFIDVYAPPSAGDDSDVAYC